MTTLQSEQDAVRDFLAAGWRQGRTYDVGAVPANPVTWQKMRYSGTAANPMPSIANAKTPA